MTRRGISDRPCCDGPVPAMMRQYELVERVRRYNPQTDEALLDRAYVYAMKAHGTQLRASGDPYFSHPLEVAAILTELKLDDATIIAALLHDTIEDTGPPRPRSSACSAPDRAAGGRSHQDQEAGSGVQAGQAGGKPAQAAPRHRRRRARAAGEAGGPPAQHAHAEIRAAGKARSRRPGNPGHLRPARRPHGYAGDARGTGGSLLPPALPGSLCLHHRARRRTA